jgi:hypothetical protein
MNLAENDTIERDFGNEQEFPVADKERPTLGPTEGAQDVATLNRIVVPMPAFSDPNNPMANSGSVNLPLDKHPVTHSDDFAESLAQGGLEDHPVESTIGAEAIRPDGSVEPGQDPSEGFPKDRKKWTKAQWQQMAAYYELPTSGNLKTVKGRVEGHEKELAKLTDRNATDWVDDIKGAKDAQALSDIRANYERTGHDFSTVTDAFASREQEFAAEGGAGGPGTDNNPQP